LAGTRRLFVIADDLGIGPATSAGILDLAEAGVVTGTVLLSNAPHAEEAVRLWRRRGMPVQLGWHPNLTLDRPILPPARVPSLVRPDGRFHELGAFLIRLFSGRVQVSEVEAELAAQYGRFIDLVGSPPLLVNGHHHVHVFPLVGALLRRLLDQQRPRPYLRRVRESPGLWLAVPGARLKRAFLATLGTLAARRQERAGLPGADCLAGISSPRGAAAPDLFLRWLSRVPGRDVELMVHPGYFDDSLFGRDGEPGDGVVERRADELQLLRHPAFGDACRAAGFDLAAPAQTIPWAGTGGPHVA
jgi:predicted glycoside hydrolase/deacetylase ChbG (UPF0249 family)